MSLAILLLILFFQVLYQKSCETKKNISYQKKAVVRPSGAPKVNSQILNAPCRNGRRIVSVSDCHLTTIPLETKQEFLQRLSAVLNAIIKSTTRLGWSNSSRRIDYLVRSHATSSTSAMIHDPGRRLPMAFLPSVGTVSPSAQRKIT